MSADVYRAIVEHLVTSKLKKKGKHLYFARNGDSIDTWPHKTMKDKPVFFWWLSKSVDKSTKGPRSHDKGKRVVEYGADLAGMWSGPMAGAIFDMAMGTIGAPGVGPLVQTGIELGIAAYKGRGFGDPDEMQLQRDNRAWAKGKDAWYHVTWQQDFVCGGVAALVPQYQQTNGTNGIIAAIRIGDNKKHMNDWISNASTRGEGYARELAFGASTLFFISQGGQIVPMNRHKLEGMGWKAGV